MQPVSKLEREMNKTYSKFIAESNKRELKCDMIDPAQYNPFERSYVICCRPMMCVLLYLNEL